MKGPQTEGLTEENLRRLYLEDDGASLESVAAKLGCHRETARRWLHRHGLPIKTRWREGPRVAKELGNREWLSEQIKSKTDSEIAAELGCSNAIVSYWVYQHGLRDKDIGKSEICKAAYRKKWPEGRMGEVAGNWRGGRRILPSGYVYIHTPEHPNASQAGYVAEHRLVMEKKLGRYLESSEVVHHLDGNKRNNDLDNLAVLVRGQHVSEHFEASHEVLESRRHLGELEEENALLKRRIEELETRLKGADLD